ncbi:MAG: DUF3617 family protein [Methylococcaceae bacterium]|nr:DUF3617 family protein [Methylococcaceae bacterium]
MKRNIFLITLCLAVNHNVIAADVEPDIKEGLWELTSTATMSGMPMEMPPMKTTSKECMSKKSAMDPRTLLKNQNCEITDMKIQSNNASWKMSCNQQGIKMTGDGNINYQHESFNGVFNMNMQGEGGAMKIVTKTVGRYLGACK